MGYRVSTWDRRTCAGLSKTERFYAISCVKVYGPLFAEPTVTRIITWTCLKTISCHSYSRIWTEISFFYKIGIPPPPHFHHEGTSYLNRKMVAWIGRGGTVAWLPRSPDLSPMGFSVWGYVKDKVSVPPLQVRKNYGRRQQKRLRPLMRAWFIGIGTKSFADWTSATWHKKPHWTPVNICR